MVLTNHERVGKGLDLLRAGLAPFVDREIESVFMNDAPAQASQLMGEDRILAGNPLAEWDAARPRC